MDPGLYIVGTPIGNLGDLTSRGLETLKEATHILAEDTRHTRKLLSRHEIHVPLSSCHKFNEASRVEDVVTHIAEHGAAVALVSNAGMPVVSDPGSRLVRACREAGLRVTVVPGPSAVTSAIALSGFDGAGFRFEGFLSHKSAARRRRLRELADESVPVVLFESPYRVLKLVEDMEVTLGEREVFVAREMTKRFEQTYFGAPAALREEFGARAQKGEFVLVIAPAPKRSSGSGKQPGSRTAIDTVPGQ